MKSVFWTIICLSVAVCSLQAQTLPLNTDLLRAIKDAYDRGDKDAEAAVNTFAQVAGKAAKAAAPTVKSKRMAPSNDPRDYVSLSRYWWPDSTKADGLPYIRHDGKVNPEIDDYASHKASGKMANAVDALSVMYYITGDTLYAYHCARYLRTWFTDLKTGMNPNMTYSQLIPGRTWLRGTGVLDARHICRALNMSLLLDNYKGWTADDRQQLQAWGEAFLYWLEHSTQGQKEREAANNHGLWFDVTHMEVLAFLNRQEDIRRIITDDLLRKLDIEIASDGSLPEELKRTLSLHYSTFVLEAITQAASLAKSAQINLWGASTASGKKITDIIDHLLPYYLAPEKWPHQQIKPFEQQRATIVLYDAGLALNNKKYLNAARKIGINKNSKKIQTILYYQLNNK